MKLPFNVFISLQDSTLISLNLDFDIESRYHTRVLQFVGFYVVGDKPAPHGPV